MAGWAGGGGDGGCSRWCRVLVDLLMVAVGGVDSGCDSVFVLWWWWWWW